MYKKKKKFETMKEKEKFSLVMIEKKIRELRALYPDAIINFDKDEKTFRVKKK